MMSFHEHVHDHHHDGDDTFYIDQLCMVAISGAFGAVCLALYFWQTKMLELLLGPQFHIYVLLSGAILLGVALVRAGALWVQVGKLKQAHMHDHNHDHESTESAEPVHSCEHEHAHGEMCNHEHGRHDHSHTHQHAHSHSHGDSHSHVHHSHGNHGHGDHSHADHSHADHSHADHDHGWAPWRYVVLLLPIVMFLLGIPNKPPALAQSVREDYTASAEAAGLAATGTERWAQFGLALLYCADSSKQEATPIDFITLKNAGEHEGSRRQWGNEMITVRGQFQPNATNDRLFNLVRFKINCCFNDAIPISIPMRCREPLPAIKSGEWVQVRGRVQFQRTGNSFVTVVTAPTNRDVEPCAPEARPYVQ